MNPEHQYDQAQKLLSGGDHGAAYKILRKLDAAIPNHPGILYLLGSCQSLGGNKANAVSSYLRAIKLQPNFAEAYNNAGLDLCALDRHQEAISYFEEALKIIPTFKEAAINRASTLISLHKLTEAISELELLLKVYPDDASVLTNIGNAFAAASKHEGALNFYEAAHKIRPEDTKISAYYIATLETLRRWDECIRAYDQLPSDSIERIKLQTSKIHSQLRINDWSVFSIDGKVLEQNLSPLSYLYCCQSQASQLSNASHYAANFQVKPPLPSTKNKKIRVGYVSADFREHPVGYLIAGMFAAHDESQFEIFCFSTSPPDICHGKISERIKEACDDFVFLNNLSDSEATETLRKFNLDVAFDLGGYTTAARTNLFAARIAPIQISYLGFPGTMGAPFIDYLISDPIVTPKSLFSLYSEKIISLPESFQANDDLRYATSTSRQEQGFSVDDLILACFNQSSKITPDIFNVWMQALRFKPNAILWLAQESPSQANNLRKAAENLGVEANRLHFGEHVSYAEHLGRYAIVDLALDTSPFNGGTTTSDALWGGAPVLTLCGETYANRMASSLLQNLGFSSLITGSTSEYQDRLLSLLANPGQLALLKSQLCTAKKQATAFNTKRFTGHFESGLRIAVERSRSGLAPDHISVPASP